MRWILVASCVVLGSTTPGQSPTGGIEYLGEADPPSVALANEIEAGHHDFVWFDVGMGVRDAVQRMQREWLFLEGQRTDALHALLDAMLRQLRTDESEAGRACAAVAQVALSFRLGEDGEAPEPMAPGPERDERDEVWLAGAGRLRFAVGTPSVDWVRARVPELPSLLERFGELSAAHRSSVYLETYLATWTPVERAAWSRAVVSQQHTEASLRLRRVDGAVRWLLGADSPMPGVIGACAMPDVDRLRMADPGLSSWQRLEGAMATPAGGAPASVRAAVLAVTAELCAAGPRSELFLDLPAEQWRAKWYGAASFAYVALRQIDALAVPMCGCPDRRLPRVVVEPLPEVWRRLRALDRLQDRVGEALRGEPVGPARRDWYDDVCDALDRQMRGESLPAGLESRLLVHLREGFGFFDNGLEVLS